MKKENEPQKLESITIKRKKPQPFFFLFLFSWLFVDLTRVGRIRKDNKLSTTSPLEHLSSRQGQKLSDELLRIHDL